MLDIYFDDRTEKVTDDITKLIQDVLDHAAKMEDLKGSPEISITFMTDEEIRKLNAEYRGKDKATDVISFALEEMTEGEVAIVQEDDMPIVLGDIIISVETANRQAAEYGHDEKREIGFLALHGFLHLLGYDHMTEDDEKKMFGRQKDILSSFGLER
ncbi:rRNA maturation RNase YbeY [Sporosarcina thermotolerans]|uniref:Endoribonuclease YbeY n=1 Tax=Sporosarcina thermotolerans TaxID=633404 RepID=A0AAW9A8L1_9BACL|nr:rRNA maturation RNase YbeY [Sporosarcina thermotolerans]MDW0117384.1 rRNA maturation RNase YbeY [Sporosarcina thermotolerans]WHT47521.1 rRNA maturation RNase YbeY [Sporosarcina thermotolerans]